MTREALAQAISDAEPIHPPPVPVRLYITTTALAFGVKVDDLLSESRQRTVTDARHVAIALVYALSNLTLHEVGDEFDRDHSTVMHAVQRVLNTPQLASWAAAVRKTIEQGDDRAG